MKANDELDAPAQCICMQQVSEDGRHRRGEEAHASPSIRPVTQKYVIKVTLDQTQCTVKKKYDDITRFLDLHTKKYDLSDLQADMKEKINIRTKKQVEVCQKIFNRFNSILRDSRYTEQTLLCLKEQLYHFLDSEEPPSND